MMNMCRSFRVKGRP